MCDRVSSGLMFSSRKRHTHVCSGRWRRRRQIVVEEHGRGGARDLALRRRRRLGLDMALTRRVLHAYVAILEEGVVEMAASFVGARLAKKVNERVIVVLDDAEFLVDGAVRAKESDQLGKSRVRRQIAHEEFGALGGGARQWHRRQHA